MSFSPTGVYLDYNASAPVPSEVKFAISELLSQNAILANPSSVHRAGQRAKRLINQARQSIADSLGNELFPVDPEQILFSSSGSESNQWAIRSGLAKAKRWIVSKVEHDSVLQMKQWAISRGIEVIDLGVNEEGQPLWKELDTHLNQASQASPDTSTFLSIIYVNNETGVITDLEQLDSITSQKRKQKQLEIHIDAAQAWGKLPILLETLPADYVTFSGHKLSGIAGTGVLWVRPGRAPAALLPGKQERGRRSGTENLLGIVGLGIACKHLTENWFSAREMRDWMETEIVESIPGTKINGQKSNRISQTSSLSFEGISGEGLLLALDLEGYSLSAGSACASGALEPSHVLIALGLPPSLATSSLRVSFSKDIQKETLQDFITVLGSTVRKLRGAKL